MAQGQQLPGAVQGRARVVCNLHCISTAAGGHVWFPGLMGQTPPHAWDRRPARCVLIGPPAVGKSTVAPLVAAALGSPWVDADEIAAPYYAEASWSPAMLSERPAQLGWEHFHTSLEPALVHAVERVVQDHPDAVVAMGAGHTHPTDPLLRARVARALEGAFVVLLRPAQDVDRSVRILRERCRHVKWTDWHIDGIDWIRRWCTDQQDELLADATVVTEGRSPAEVAAEVVVLLEQHDVQN